MLCVLYSLLIPIYKLDAFMHTHFTADKELVLHRNFKSQLLALACRGYSYLVTTIRLYLVLIYS